MDMEFYKTNREKIVELMEDEAMMVLFSGTAAYKAHDQFYKFIPNKNFYYLTGFAKEKAMLVLSKFRGKTQELLFIEKPDSYLELYNGKMMDKDDMVSLTGIQTVHYTEDHNKMISKLFNNQYYRSIYLDFYKRGIRTIPTEEMAFAELVLKNYPYLKMLDAAPLIGNLRKIKTPEEINTIRKAVQLTGLGLTASWSI